ncbi:MAG: cupin-like domain-containing protein [Burkholderiaceae bacterium]|nr:cupin-like domain-containing protein [Burkholderiaceae bacterium]
MLPSAKPMHVIAGISPQALSDDMLRSTEPLVLRGLVSTWPMVQAAQTSERAATDYLLGLYRGAAVDAFLGAPEFGGCYFYNDDISGFNFHTERLKLDTVLDQIGRHAVDANPPGIYVGSATVDACLPGFMAENDVDLGSRNPLASIWIGNRASIPAHYDVPDNLACVAAGHRRFTLFPPEALEDLYIGPLDFTPAGQPVSLVDFSNPDLTRFPNFARAMESAQVAELGPGDAIFIPSMWWHRVESLDSLNILVNYWWRQSPEYMDNAMNALMMALLSVRDLPKEQREAWSKLFSHYVFHPNEKTTGHIPEHARRILGPTNADVARSLRAQILKKLNR